MDSRSSRERSPRWYLIPVRVVLVTLVVTSLTFAVCLFLGIAGLLAGAKLHGSHPDMSMAYRLIALPAALIVCAVVLISSTALELRHYRRAKTLEGIARASR
ncbi:MAG: hypothetical protein DMG90_05900 [Acidobacteria bacterium]|jgi:uncharacterized BrkB/YihY/UPF0761 family membrane protein|nr:MAG: hypothetical protein DMG90_05900 [Acidobacteriota bacterium]